MKIARATCFLAALTAIAPGCAGKHVKLGVEDPAARSVLGATSIAFVRDHDLHLARGDGTGERKIIAGERLGPGGTILLPSLTADGGRMLFMGATGLDVRDSTVRELSLNILDMEGRHVTAWRQIMLERFVSPGPDGRQQIFDVAAAAWSQEGDRIALGLNRGPGAGGDAVAVFDASGRPLALHSLGDHDLARVSSICWMAGGGSLLLGLEGDDSVTGRIARLDLEGRGRAGKVVTIALGQYPAIEPGDGRLAAVEQRDGKWDMVVMSADGEVLERFADLAGRAPHRPYWSSAGRYLYYYSLASIGPLGLIEINMLRVLDTGTGEIFDLVRLG